jgi:ATP-dependent Clp protease ATP-binding subunit ClpC
MSTLNKDLLDATTRDAMNRASELMRAGGRPLLMPEIILLAFLKMPNATAYRMLQLLAAQRAFKLEELEKDVDSQLRTRQGRAANFNFITDQNVAAPISDETLIALDEARAIALATGEIYIASEHLLGALSQTGVSTAGLLQKRGVTPTAIATLMKEGVVSRRTTTHNWVDAARKGNLTPVYPRERLLHDLTTLLTLSSGRNVILLGPAGVGRRSLAQALAFAIAQGKGPAGLKSVVEISEAAWLDNPQLAMQVGLRQAEGGVLFVPNIARFFGRAESNSMASASRELQKAIVEGTLTVIGSATEAEFAEKIKPTTAVVDKLRTLLVSPATADETVGILRVLDAGLERDYELTVADEAHAVAQQLSSRYIGAQPQPSAAVQVLHRACALIKSARNGVAAESAPPMAPLIVDAEAVMRAVSAMTGIPTNKLGADERAKFANIEDALRHRVLGQDDAIKALARAVKSARVGLKDPKRPIGSFLFLGPSGTGKTELAKTLAEFLFGTEDALVALDMTEYQKDDTINRLIGSPPGYVGFESGGQLTEKILKSPYAVVVFDEVEKAHPRILDILLQVMEEGRLTDGQGRIANFSETVIILTSNLGAPFLNDAALKFDDARELAMGDVRAFFRPEFLNRMDDIVMFKPLSTDVLRNVLDLMISKEAKLAQARGIKLEVTQPARVWLLAQNNEPHMGARPLRRILQRNIREKLADYLLTLDAPPSLVIVDAETGATSLTFKTQ